MLPIRMEDQRDCTAGEGRKEGAHDEQRASDQPAELSRQAVHEGAGSPSFFFFNCDGSKISTKLNEQEPQSLSHTTMLQAHVVRVWSAEKSHRSDVWYALHAEASRRAGRKDA